MDYSGAYTAGGLLLDEFEALFPILQSPDWEGLLLKEQKENQFLKINSEQARARVMIEIRRRNRLTGNLFWQLWPECSRQEKAMLMFYLCLKAYRLVYDFHFEVTVPRVLTLDLEVNPKLYNQRLEEISSREEKVSSWTDSTRKKLISAYLTMMKNAGILNNKLLEKPEASQALFCFFIKNNDPWMLDAFFLKSFEKESFINRCQ